MSKECLRITFDTDVEEERLVLSFLKNPKKRSKKKKIIMAILYYINYGESECISEFKNYQLEKKIGKLSLNELEKIVSIAEKERRESKDNGQESIKLQKPGWDSIQTPKQESINTLNQYTSETEELEDKKKLNEDKNDRQNSDTLPYTKEQAKGFLKEWNK